MRKKIPKRANRSFKAPQLASGTSEYTFCSILLSAVSYGRILHHLKTVTCHVCGKDGFCLFVFFFAPDVFIMDQCTEAVEYFVFFLNIEKLGHGGGKGWKFGISRCKL